MFKIGDTTDATHPYRIIILDGILNSVVDKNRLDDLSAAAPYGPINEPMAQWVFWAPHQE